MKHFLTIISIFVGLNLQAQIVKDIHFVDENKNKKIKKTLDVEYIDEEGVKREAYTLVIDIEGEQKIIKWDGTGEMPLAIKEALEESKDKTTGNVDLTAKKVYEKKIVTKKQTIVEDKEVNDHINTDLPRYMLGGSRSTLGMTAEQTHEGIIIKYLDPESIAEKSGLTKGDILLKINSTYILTLSLFDQAMGSYQMGENNEILVLRDGKEMKLVMK